MADYRVTVRETSRVTASDGDITELTSLSPGCLRESADGLLLTYTDTTEGGKVFNRIEIKDDSVSVRRTGAVSMALTFCVGQSERTVYGVPPFTFDMTVTTESLKVRREESGVRIGLRFRSTVGGAPQSTELVISARIREAAP